MINPGAVSFIFFLAFSTVLAQDVIKARVLLSGKSVVRGMLNLTQTDGGPVTIVGRISGLSPGAHGFHVHQSGDVFTNGCDSTGPHFNPLKMLHGAPDGDKRHHGDLGNIVADDENTAIINLSDSVIQLSGPHSIVGRAFVVHEKADDLGLGGDDGSTKTGNAGSRLACGIIFIA